MRADTRRKRFSFLKLSFQKLPSNYFLVKKEL